jgi:hypothetical protein
MATSCQVTVLRPDRARGKDLRGRSDPGAGRRGRARGVSTSGHLSRGGRAIAAITENRLVTNSPG